MDKQISNRFEKVGHCTYIYLASLVATSQPDPLDYAKKALKQYYKTTVGSASGSQSTTVKSKNPKIKGVWNRSYGTSDSLSVTTGARTLCFGDKELSEARKTTVTGASTGASESLELVAIFKDDPKSQQKVKNDLVDDWITFAGRIRNSVCAKKSDSDTVKSVTTSGKKIWTLPPGEPAREVTEEEMTIPEPPPMLASDVTNSNENSPNMKTEVKNEISTVKAPQQLSNNSSSSGAVLAPNGSIAGGNGRGGSYTDTTSKGQGQAAHAAQVVSAINNPAPKSNNNSLKRPAPDKNDGTLTEVQLATIAANKERARKKREEFLAKKKAAAAGEGSK